MTPASVSPVKFGTITFEKRSIALMEKDLPRFVPLRGVSAGSSRLGQVPNCGPPHTIPVASVRVTLRLTVHPGCMEAGIVELARWVWQEAQHQGARA